MLAPSPLRPVVSLTDDELRSTLADLARDRARLDGREAELLAEFNQRQASVADGQLTAKSWLVHHTGVGSATAGSRVALAQKLRHMPLIAAGLAEGAVTMDHVRVMGRAVKEPRCSTELGPAVVQSEAIDRAQATIEPPASRPTRVSDSTPR